MTTGAPLEYLSDTMDMTSPRPDIRVMQADTAAAEVSDLLEERIMACLRARPGRAGIMLSGGIDSIAIAVAARNLGIDALTVTITTEGTSGAQERHRARAVSDRLGFEHVSVDLTYADLEKRSEQAMALIGVSEVWEVGAAVPVLAGMDAFRRAGVDGPILTGSGADAMFAGGRTLTNRPGTEDATVELDAIVRAESHKNFQRLRLVPDFYARLLGKSDEARWIHVFQTAEFWQLSEQLTPQALYGNKFDKYFLRMATESASLLDSALVWTQKSPLQRSSGILAALAHLARTRASRSFGAGTYSDAMTESFQDVAARLYLEILRIEQEKKGSRYEMFLRNPEGLNDPRYM